MVRKESLDQLEKYIKSTLERHIATINHVKVNKKYVYQIKSLERANLLGLVICDNIEYAAKLVCAIDKSDSQEDLYDYWLKKFSEESEKMNIDPNKPVGIDILVF